ncbi:MAG TPA: M20/M25/M40 family metallo-hydrolase [Erysipelotrichaceae bacterium]|nr:M20/M25/M40 family metallo-hydrolase [Erysipelotrichaceae bacterium]HQB32071.1 M20/M25/M40 family metallo-hydrolase [Erysipelotrichaceae bacterium]
MKNFDLADYLQELAYLCSIDSGKTNTRGKIELVNYFENRFRQLKLKTRIEFYQDDKTSPLLLVSNCDFDNIDVLMIGHLDTVFEDGLAEKHPFTLTEDNIATGLGCIDCKGGCLSVYHLIKLLIEHRKDNFNFCVIFNSDEEAGSSNSEYYFHQFAEKSRYCFVFEPARRNDEFVSQRKGSENYLVRCRGLAAHAGVEPEKGASAVLELAKWVVELYRLVDYEKGTTLNISHFSGGMKEGSVPEDAQFNLNYRFLDDSAPARLQQVLTEMKTNPFDSRTSIEIIDKGKRPALVLHENSRKLFEKLQEVGKEVNYEIKHVTTGGGSDGNFISNHQVATIDGCGPTGGDMHTVREFIVIDSIEKRLKVMYHLILKLFAD